MFSGISVLAAGLLIGMGIAIAGLVGVVVWAIHSGVIVKAEKAVAAEVAKISADVKKDFQHDAETVVNAFGCGLRRDILAVETRVDKIEIEALAGIILRLESLEESRKAAIARATEATAPQPEATAPQPEATA